MEILNTITQLMIIITLLSVTILLITIRNKTQYNRRILDRPARTLSDTIDLIDEFIKHEFDNYRIMNLEHKNLEYINAELENKIINEVLAQVMTRMSTNILQTLSLYYAKSAVEEVITEKVYFEVTVYVYTINTTYVPSQQEKQMKKNKIMEKLKEINNMNNMDM